MNAGQESGNARAYDGEHPEGQGKPISPIDVQKALKGIGYPASKVDVLQCAECSHADSRVIDMLKRIPDCVYSTPASVSKALGKLT